MPTNPPKLTVSAAIAALASVVMIALGPATMWAQRYCAPIEFRTDDMAGRYTAPGVRLEVSDCGGITLGWEAYPGAESHFSEEIAWPRAVYVGVQRDVSGAVGAIGLLPDPHLGAYPNNSATLVLKPDVPGVLHVILGDARGTIVAGRKVCKLGTAMQGRCS